jgi:hypothetical protein
MVAKVRAGVMCRVMPGDGDVFDEDFLTPLLDAAAPRAFLFYKKRYFS